jgi:very-short-patch-repair endonuclease
VAVLRRIFHYSLLDEELARYAKHYATHLDFLLYHRITKKPIMAIEVDGYQFHKKDSLQGERDIKKNQILQLYGLPLVRFATTGSGEYAILEGKLKEILGR